EQRYAAAAVGRAGQACEDEMNDVLGQIVLAEGDEDLLPGDPVLAGVLSVLDRRRGRAHRAEVAARLWLGEVHRARPLAADQLRQIGRLLRLATVMIERLGRAD